MIKRRVQSFLEADSAFFSFGKSEITAQNNHMLIDGCTVYAAVLIFYTIMTNVANRSEILQRMYWFFDVIHAGFCIAVLKRSKQRKSEYRSTQVYCALLEVSVLGFFVLEAVYTSQTQHSLYIPIAILLILLLYVHSVFYTAAITLLYVLSYAVLSYSYKTPQAYTNDLYIAIATLISSGIGYVLIARMRHNESSLLRKYECLSKTDVLTGLYNKAAMEAQCEQIVSELNHPCALIILDLDSFKGVNDAYGHDVGDEVLRLVGQTLRMSFREADYKGRFGGDEFMVLMDDCDNLSVVTEWVAKIIVQIAELRFSQPELSVQCSVGIAVKKEGEPFQSFFKRADHALYEAKADKRRKYQIAP